METITKEFEIEIGKIRYTLDIEFNYNPGTSEIDPSEGVDSELADWDIDEPIHAWDMEEEYEYFVSDPKEVQMVKDWIDIYSLFNEAVL